VLLPTVLNPYGALAVEPLKTSLFRGLATVVGVSWVVGRLTQRGLTLELSSNPVVRAGLLVGLASVLSTALALNPPVSLFGSYVRGMGLLTELAGLLLLLSGADLLRDAARRERLLTAMLLGSVAPCLYAAGQWLGLDPLSWKGVTGITSTLGSPTFLGGYLVLVVPFTAYRVVVHARAIAAGAGAWPTAAYMLTLALLLLQCMVLVRAGIRGPLLGLATAVVLFALLAARAMPRAPRWAPHAVVGAAVVAVLGLAFVAGGGQELLAGRRFLAALDPDGSGAERLVVWQSALGLPLRDPLRAALGFGPEMQAVAFEHAERVAGMPGNQLWDRAHNLVLDAWLTGGWLGLVALLWLLAAAGRQAWLARSAADERQRLLAVAVLAALAGHVFEATFGFHTVVIGALFWTVLAVAAGLARGVWQPPPRSRFHVVAPVVATVAGVLLLPALAAPAIADALHGDAQLQASPQAAARQAEHAATWAPWVEEIPRFAATQWQELGFGPPGRAAELALERAAANLDEAVRRAPLDPFTHLRVARHEQALAARSRDPAVKAAHLERAEHACQRALSAGPYRLAAWEICAEVSQSRGAAAEAAARAERARQLRSG
jgi:O-antigen ligase